MEIGECLKLNECCQAILGRNVQEIETGTVYNSTSAPRGSTTTKLSQLNKGKKGVSIERKRWFWSAVILGFKTAGGIDYVNLHKDKPSLCHNKETKAALNQDKRIYRPWLDKDLHLIIHLAILAAMINSLSILFDCQAFRSRDPTVKYGRSLTSN